MADNCALAKISCRLNLPYKAFAFTEIGPSAPNTIGITVTLVALWILLISNQLALIRIKFGSWKVRRLNRALVYFHTIPDTFMPARNRLGLLSPAGAGGGGGGGSLPHRRFQGSSFFIPPHRLGGVGYSQPGYVFWYFVLNRVSILSIFVGRWRGPRDSVDQAVNSFVIANGLNKREFRYLLLSYTGYRFGLNVVNNVLNRVGKSAIFVFNRVRV